jgi:hypothetical protein
MGYDLFLSCLHIANIFSLSLLSSLHIFKRRAAVRKEDERANAGRQAVCVYIFTERRNFLFSHYLAIYFPERGA